MAGTPLAWSSVPAPVARRATAADRETILSTVLAAFVADPAFRYFFPTDDSYADEAPAFIGDLLDQRLASDTVWIVDDGAAVALWNSPGPSRAGLPPGLTSPTAERIKRFDAVVQGMLPRQPHWYLGILATHPDHAGRGLGRVAMSDGLALAREDGLPSCLETVTQVNVAIYERYGWRVTASAVIADVTVRVMQVP
jgi:GNAT superfamily N-acetyltransferase